MPKGVVAGLSICADAGQPMVEVAEVTAEAGNGLIGGQILRW
jgi:hypothetical protein